MTWAEFGFFFTGFIVAHSMWFLALLISKTRAVLMVNPSKESAEAATNLKAKTHD